MNPIDQAMIWSMLILGTFVSILYCLACLESYSSGDGILGSMQLAMCLICAGFAGALYAFVGGL